MHGAELCARFAIAPNSKRYCGNRKFISAFSKYLKNKSAKNKLALEHSLCSFHAHHEYLKLLSRTSAAKPFDKKTAQAFWFGANWLHKKNWQARLRTLILRSFCGEGMLNKERAAALAKNLPDGFVPHHSFHTLYIHTISGVIAPTLRNADSCRVGWGKVIARKGRTALLQSQKLAMKGGKIVLVPVRKKVSLTCAGILLVPNAKVGDGLAFHWGVAAMKISTQQVKTLERATRQNIAVANKISCFPSQKMHMIL